MPWRESQLGTKFTQGGGTEMRKQVTQEIQLSRQNQDVGGKIVLSFQSSLPPQSRYQVFYIMCGYSLMAL